ncbi:hypothetical protein EGH23_19710 [Halomicroarcula sp. F27]|uniref:Uncharacterized protein n=1 Tax=Haloarcula nitratireducens TaxID=2487749 RepID=A0AAW4PG88_9EURY|nr:hypothetical protein [Halomicroarcula nitratireducens]
MSSNGHAHFDLVHNGSSLYCVCFQYRSSSLDADLDNGLQVAIKGSSPTTRMAGRSRSLSRAPSRLTRMRRHPWRTNTYPPQNTLTKYVKRKRRRKRV